MNQAVECHAPPFPDIEQLIDRSARALRDGDVDVVPTIVAGATAEVVGATAVGLAVLGSRGTVTTLGASGAHIEELHTSQSRLGEGPCLDALPGVGPGTNACAHVPDLDDHRRWPRWSREVRTAGYREVLSFPITGPGLYAALVFYAPAAHVLARDAELTGAVFADHLGDLLGAPAGLAPSGPSSRVLHHATGIVAGRHGVTTAEAFALLVTATRGTGHDLRTVARRLTGDSTGPR